MAWGEDEFEATLEDMPERFSEHGRHVFFGPDLAYWLIFLIVLTVFVLALAWVWGQWRGGKHLQKMRRHSVSYIYDHVQYHIEQTLKSQGASMIDNARELVTVLDGRLSGVIGIEAQQGKLIKALQKALKGEAEVEKPKSSKIKVGMSVDEQRVAIWEAVHSFKAFWGDKTRVFELLETAQIELYQTPDDHLQRLSFVGLVKPKTDVQPEPPEPDFEPPMPEQALTAKGKAKAKKSWLRANKAMPAADSKA
jgi:hypothetical protein